MSKRNSLFDDGNNYVYVLDTETTGLNYGSDSLLEIACVKCVLTSDGIEPTEEVFSSFVLYKDKIPPHVTAINRISERDVRDAPPVDEVLRDLQSFINGKLILAYNAAFDAAFVSKYNDWFTTLTYIDVRKPAEAAVPGLKAIIPEGAYKLSRVLRLFGIENTKVHSAAGDAIALAKLCSILYRFGTLNLKKKVSKKQIKKMIGGVVVDA